MCLCDVDVDVYIYCHGYRLVNLSFSVVCIDRFIIRIYAHQFVGDLSWHFWVIWTDLDFHLDNVPVRTVAVRFGRTFSECQICTFVRHLFI